MKRFGKFVRLILNIAGNFICRYDVLYVVEDADWVVKSEGVNYKKYLGRKGVKLRLSITHRGARKKVVHFGAVSTLINSDGIKNAHPSNKLILTWYHVPEDDKRINYLKSLSEQISFLHTSCQISKKIFLDHKFPDSKLKVIPIPIDLEVYDVIRFNKEATKKKYQLPLDKIIIGSFQKDGDGWGEGMNPKYVKGPDLFCDAIESIEQKKQVHILLSGPSRGYVKSRLQKSGISFTHIYLKDPSAVVELYSALDAYIISSRVEGGPKALVESWAMRIPLVSTSVGMCADYGVDGVNMYLSKECSSASIVAAVHNLLPKLGSPEVLRVVESASERVRDLSYERCSDEWLKLYKSLIDKTT